MSSILSRKKSSIICYCFGLVILTFIGVLRFNDPLAFFWILMWPYVHQNTHNGYDSTAIALICKVPIILLISSCIIFFLSKNEKIYGISSFISLLCATLILTFLLLVQPGGDTDPRLGYTLYPSIRFNNNYSIYPQPPAKGQPSVIPISKSALSKQKLEEVNSLDQKLDGKLESLNSKNKWFDGQIKLFVSKVDKIITDNALKNYADVRKNPDANNYLEGIRKARGYQDIVKNATTETKNAKARLHGIAIQLELDIHMLDGLEGNQMDDIIEKLNLVINDIEPSAKELVIDEKNTVLLPMESIWNEYLGVDRKKPR